MRILKLRKYISVFVLFGFFVAITPRSWWHDCHNHNDIELSGKVHFEKNNCFACDFELGEIETPINYYFDFPSVVSAFALIDEEFSFNSSFLGFSHRGPPNFV
jgi:hypothetical protein